MFFSRLKKVTGKESKMESGDFLNLNQINPDCQLLTKMSWCTF